MDDWDRLVQELRIERRIVVLTGAGVSAESGIPTFRDKMEGLWARFDPQELASPQGFRKQPRLVFDWYAWRREQVLQAKPNPAHEILALWEQSFPHFTLITQNVDGLHTRAGSQKVIEMHGCIHRLKCMAKSHPSPWVLPTAEGQPPICGHCGSYLRPDVVWFGETLDPGILHTIDLALRACELFIAIGTSGQVYPAAGFLSYVASRGVQTVVINPDASAAGDADIFLQETAVTALEALQARLEARPQ